MEPVYPKPGIGQIPSSSQSSQGSSQGFSRIPDSISSHSDTGNPVPVQQKTLSQELREAFFAASPRVEEILLQPERIDILNLSEPKEALIANLQCSEHSIWEIQQEDENLQIILKGLTHLKTLDLTGNRQITRPTLTSCLQNNPGLRVLILRDCISLTQADHLAIAQAVKGLEVLVLDAVGVMGKVYVTKTFIDNSSLELYIKNNPGLQILSFPGSANLASLLKSPSFKALPLVCLDVIQPGSNSFQTFEALTEDTKKAMEEFKAVLQAASQFPNLKELHLGHPHLELGNVLPVLQDAWNGLPKLERVVCFGKVHTLSTSPGHSGRPAIHLFEKNGEETISWKKTHDPDPAKMLLEIFSPKKNLLSAKEIDLLFDFKNRQELLKG